MHDFAVGSSGYSVSGGMKLEQDMMNNHGLPVVRAQGTYVNMYDVDARCQSQSSSSYGSGSSSSSYDDMPNENFDSSGRGSDLAFGDRMY